MFKFAAPVNTQNDRVYGRTIDEISDERIIKKRKAFPQRVMVSAGVSYLGKTPIHFVTTGCSVNSEYFCNNILGELLPSMSALSGDEYIFHQDGARFHTSHYSLEYLRDRVPELLEPEMWPPHSPDLNPLDYAIWGALDNRRSGV